MSTEVFINRYNDEYSFTLTEDGHLLWEGPFKWCRFGMPNDYTRSYREYIKDGSPFGKMDLSVFKKNVHEYDNGSSKYIMEKYVHMVDVLKDVIDMVDPSGGPYISVGMSAKFFHKDAGNKKIKAFEKIEEGYKLILE